MATIEATERALLERVIGGESSEFGAIVQRYQRRAYFAALGILGNEEDAFDLAQEAFIRAHDQLVKFDPSRPFYPWFHRLLRNLCLNYIRGKKRRRESSLERAEEQGIYLEAGPESSPERAAEIAVLSDHIAAALDELRPAHREILVMREFEELSYKEIAERLDIPRGTVMSRLHSARRALREELAPRLHGEITP